MLETVVERRVQREGHAFHIIRGSHPAHSSSLETAKLDSCSPFGSPRPLFLEGREA